MTAFLLSPARCDGRRAQVLLNPDASFDLAVRLREDGAPVGEVFAFLSGLYFRGKLAYASAFGAGSTHVITTDRGIVSPGLIVKIDDVRDFAKVDLARAGESFLVPLRRDAESIAAATPSSTPIVLLGSIASPKYVEPLLRVFGERLLFPGAFIGRGDMSRGGLLLRHVDEGRELEYVPVVSAARHGKRPPRLGVRTKD